jgi:hypothetical protein
MAGLAPYVNQFTRPSHSYMYFHIAMMGNELNSTGGSDESVACSDCPTLPFD